MTALTDLAFTRATGATDISPVDLSVDYLGTILAPAIAGMTEAINLAILQQRPAFLSFPHKPLSSKISFGKVKDGIHIFCDQWLVFKGQDNGLQVGVFNQAGLERSFDLSVISRGSFRIECPPTHSFYDRVTQDRVSEVMLMFGEWLKQSGIAPELIAKARPLLDQTSVFENAHKTAAWRVAFDRR